MPKTPNDIFQEYLTAQLAGIAPSVEDFIRAHPEHEVFLRKKFKALEFVSPVGEEAAEISDLTGKTIGDFEIIREIDRGGMGVVYLALQKSLEREVALKILRPSIFTDAKQIERFRQEGRSIARLEHKGIVPVYYFGEHEGLFYIAMQHVEGLPLSTLIEHAKQEGASALTPETVKALIAAALPEEDRMAVQAPEGANWIEMACHIILDVASAVEYAHTQNILHRDIKPANIILTKDGHAVLLDFGLSKDLAAKDVTQTGEFIGTPAYSAPELLFNKDAQPNVQSDVYSLGMTLYELVTFHLPYDGETVSAVISSIKSMEPKSPGTFNVRISPTLEWIILAAIDKDRRMRPTSTSALWTSITHWLEFKETDEALQRTNSEDTKTILNIGQWIHRKSNSMTTLTGVLIVGVVMIGILAMILSLAMRMFSGETKQTQHQITNTSVKNESSTDLESNNKSKQVASKEQYEKFYWAGKTALEEGIKEYEDAAKRKGNVDAQKKRASFLLKEAVINLSKAINIDSSSAKAHYERGKAISYQLDAQAHFGATNYEIWINEKDILPANETMALQQLLSDWDFAEMNDINLQTNKDFLNDKLSSKSLLISIQPNTNITEQDKTDLKKLLIYDTDDCKSLLIHSTIADTFNMIRETEHFAEIATKNACKDDSGDVPTDALIYSNIIYHLRIDAEKAHNVFERCEKIREVMAWMSPLSLQEKVDILKSLDPTYYFGKEGQLTTLWGNELRKKYDCALPPLGSLASYFAYKKLGNANATFKRSEKEWETRTGIKIFFFSKEEYEKYARGRELSLVKNPDDAGPSFNCAYAHIDVEFMICNSTELSAMDRELIDAYNICMRIDIDKKQTKQRQDEWRNKVRNLCKTSDCLKNVYTSRIESLRSSCSSAISASTAGIVQNNTIPRKIGDCVYTKILNVTDRFGTELSDSLSEDNPSGTIVRFTNGFSQVSYSVEPSIARSQAGDEVKICLISTPQNCPPGDNRGKEYNTVNLRTNEAWTLSDSQHGCGGA